MTQEPTPHGSPVPPGVTIAGRRFGLPWIIGAVVAVLLLASCGCCGVVTLASRGNNAATQASPTSAAHVTQAPTQAPATHAPTAAPTPAVVLKFAGNGNKSSKTFTVSNTWELAWTCSGVPSGIGGSAPLFIEVYNASDNSLNFTDDVTYNCPEGAKGGGDSSTFHDSGTFYLKVLSGIDWRITVTDVTG